MEAAEKSCTQQLHCIGTGGGLRIADVGKNKLWLPSQAVRVLRPDECREAYTGRNA